jgi:threonine/homoserine/homoserine lactone efflux protein
MRLSVAIVLGVAVLGAAVLIYKAAKDATAQAKSSTDEAARTRDALAASPLGPYIFDKTKLGVTQ